MPEFDAFHERGRALEEEYFRKKDRELLEKMRLASEAERTEKDLAASTGVHDAQVLKDMAALGFTPETVVLLPLVPVLQVAWAEGGVTDAERRLLVKLARARGIVEGSGADSQLAQWMTERPDQAVFDGATRLVRAMLEAQPDGARDLEAGDIVRYCEQIANASGPFLSLRRISPEERELLNTIKGALRDR